MKQLKKKCCITFLCYFFYTTLLCQNNKAVNFFNSVISIDNNTNSPGSKLNALYSLKSKIETIKPLNDSAEILVLLKISKYEFEAKQDFQLSINLVQTALQLCKKNYKNSLKNLLVNCYYNLASSYQELMLYNNALNYYDSVLQLCNQNFVDTSKFQLDSRYNKVDVYRLLADYQKVIEESSKGIYAASIYQDTFYILYFQNRKAQALSYLNSLKSAYSTVVPLITIAKKLNEDYELAASYKTLGFIYEKQNNLDSAEYYFKKSIAIRNSTNDYLQIANDYIDLGNFYLNSRSNFAKAQYCYNQTIINAKKIDFGIERSSKIALAYLNLGENNLQQNKFEEATKCYLQSFENLNINLNKNILQNPAVNELSKVANKDLVIILMSDKTHLLLQQYKFNDNSNKSFLQAAIQTAIVTDSLITQIRHEHLGEESKLYWRDKTRTFYTHAIEASYLANNANMCFYFMEKSRAVLLNDKLNELGAAAYLPETEIKKQENFSVKIIELEQKLLPLSDTSASYQKLQPQLLNIKNEHERYIKSLETKYPEYYQYKYDDEAASLQMLQQYLAKHNQSFADYFFDDSGTFILAVTANNTKLIQLDNNQFDKDELFTFLNFCSSKEKLNGSYAAFALLSNTIYKKIFQPLNFKSGNIIICTDNIVIPFDALCTDANGKNFLLNNCSFSYVYSARYLMKQFHSAKPKGNFVGFAPVSFSPGLQVADLKNAAAAINSSANYYQYHKLFTNANASRKNFFNYACSYSVVSIFSHAKADTTDNEPVLFMQDSLIHLSELQLMNNPATKLVLLSACQTNVGRNATGEGIYSLARGFATAGIPSVSATLWKADEQTIYVISEKFNQYLSQGLNKDEALQKAKLYFLQHNNSNEKLLPYYWANMILIGNTDAIQFQQAANNYIWIIAAVIAVFITAAVIIYFKKLNRKFKPAQ